MRIQLYGRTQGLPGTAGGVPLAGAGTAELGTARGLDVLSQATSELAARAQAAQRTTDVALRTLGLRRAYSEWWVERSNDPSNFATLAADSDAAMEKLGEQALAGIDDPIAQAEIAREMSQFAGSASLEARKLQIQQQIDWSRGALEEQLWQRRQEAAGANPVDRERLVDQTLGIIGGAAASGFISPLDAEKKAHAFVDGIAEDELNLRVYNDPDGVLEDMSTDTYRGMGEDAKQRVILSAYRSAERLRSQRRADERQAEAAEKERKRATQDYTFGLMYEQARMMAVPKSELEEALRRGEIRGDQYRTLYDAYTVSEEQGGPGNPEVAANLKYRAYGGEATASDVLGLMRNGANGINQEEAKEVLDILSTGPVATTTREYKEAVIYLNGQIGVMAGIEGMSQESIAMATMARRELYQRAAANPAQSPIIIAQEVAKRYSEIGMLSRAQPRFNSADAAMDAFRKGAISLPELNTELNIWQSKQ